MTTLPSPASSLTPAAVLNFSASIIICCYTMDRFDDTVAAIRSVQAQTVPAHEIILSVDHNPTLAAALRKELGEAIIVAENQNQQGMSGNRNSGMAAATGDVFVFLDDDAEAAPDWLERLLEPLTTPGVVAVGGAANPQWIGGERPGWFPEELDWIVGCTFKGMPVPGNVMRNPIGCTMAFRRDLFEQVGQWETGIGGLGQSNKGGEEAELGLRIAKNLPDAVIKFAPSSRINHKVPAWRATFKWTVQKAFAEGVCKAKVNRYGAKLQAPRALRTETSYLRYLLLQAVPTRLVPPSPARVAQAAAIVTAMGSVAAGYWRERLRGGRA